MRLPPEFDQDDENADDNAMCRLVWSLIITLLFLAGFAILCLALTGCTLTVAPDGTSTLTADAAAIARALVVIAEK